MISPPDFDPLDAISTSAEQFAIDPVVDPILAQNCTAPVLKSGEYRTLARYLPPDPPRQGTALSTALEELASTTGRYARKNAHPGMLAYVAGPGMPTDPLAHALTAALNQNVITFQNAPGAAVVEDTVVRWMCQLAGLPTDSGGLVLPGGSWSNLTALSVAVHHTLGYESRRNGIHTGPRPVILAATSAHFSVSRAAVVLGVGEASVETVPVDENFRMDARALRTSLERLNTESGKKVCCVVASAGTTALGAIDPLNEISETCREFGVWLHVDAAYGGAALFSEQLKGSLAGIENADSITIDLHKWCYLAFDGSLLLYKNPGHARQVFQFSSDYARSDPGRADETPSFFDLSPEVSRRQRALPAYLAWRHYGLDLLGRNVEHNVACARYLADLADSCPDLETVCDPQLSICCFRFSPPSLENQAAEIDSLNEQILQELNNGDDFFLSPTRVDGRPVLRACICSHQTRANHIASLVERVRQLGQALVP
jgi:glutamate/tyrosine decarboxylase-like PLP-dependent enzyme